MTTAETVPDHARLRAAKAAQLEELVEVFANRAALAHDGVELKHTTPDRQEELLRWSAIYLRATQPELHADAEARHAARAQLQLMDPPVTSDRIVDHLFDTWQTDMARLDRSNG